MLTTKRTDKTIINKKPQQPINEEAVRPSFKDQFIRFSDDLFTSPVSESFNGHHLSIHGSRVIAYN